MALKHCSMQCVMPKIISTIMPWLRIRDNVDSTNVAVIEVFPSLGKQKANAYWDQTSLIFYKFSVRNKYHPMQSMAEPSEWLCYGA